MILQLTFLPCKRVGRRYAAGAPSERLTAPEPPRRSADHCTACAKPRRAGPGPPANWPGTTANAGHLYLLNDAGTAWVLRSSAASSTATVPAVTEIPNRPSLMATLSRARH